jgi:uncharacterized protein YuzE
MTHLNSPVFYDRSTDTMYVTFREGRVAHTVAHDERDFAVDIGEDGQPMGYEIQFASKLPTSSPRPCKSFSAATRSPPSNARKEARQRSSVRLTPLTRTLGKKSSRRAALRPLKSPPN